MMDWMQNTKATSHLSANLAHSSPQHFIVHTHTHTCLHTPRLRSVKNIPPRLSSIERVCKYTSSISQGSEEIEELALGFGHGSFVMPHAGACRAPRAILCYSYQSSWHVSIAFLFFFFCCCCLSLSEVRAHFTAVVCAHEALGNQRQRREQQWQAVYREGC